MQSVAPSFRTTAAPSHTRISELDGVRGIAILLVLGFHFIPATGPLHFLAFLFQIGWTGVDLFFVLSGYLITGILLDSVGRPSYYRNFIVRRTLRIFPAYFLSLAICAILTYYPGPVRWKDFFSAGGWWYVSYLGNIQVTLQNAWPALYLLTPLWSLQIEEQFYLTFPFIVKAAKRKSLAVILFASVIFALVLRLVLAVAAPKFLFGAYVLMPCRMDALAMGGLIAIAKRDAPEWLTRRWIPRATALSALIFVLICAIWNPSPWSAPMRTIGYTALDVACTGLLVMLIGTRRPSLVAFCRTRALVWIGTISYGLYLLHVPAAVFERRLLQHVVRVVPNGSADLLFSTIAGIAAAAISWWLFESPILKLKDRFTVRATPAHPKQAQA
jgi:peptidoglycan/LPS O-acetylase OafA/YrhL